MLWNRHLPNQRSVYEISSKSQPSLSCTPPHPTPRQLVRKLEEDLMTSRVSEVDCQAELRGQRLRLMELETQTQVSANQLRRRGEEVARLREALEAKAAAEGKMEQQVRWGGGGGERNFQTLSC